MPSYVVPYPQQGGIRMSIKERVPFFGVITAAGGIQAECTVSAIRATSPGLPLVYSEFRIEAVSRDLPDGVYTVAANHTKRRLRHQGDFWLAA
jgi:hypothetical protein